MQLRRCAAAGGEEGTQVARGAVAAAAAAAGADVPNGVLRLPANLRRGEGGEPPSSSLPSPPSTSLSLPAPSTDERRRRQLNNGSLKTAPFLDTVAVVFSVFVGLLLELIYWSLK